MKSALVRNFDGPPRYGELADPQAKEGEVLIDVSASALSPLARAQAGGGHYSSHAEFPFVPGVDGVGRLSDGTRVYFAFPQKPQGAMAEKVAIAQKLTALVPEGVDDLTAAAIANPGMSSWTALGRAKMVRGESVLINGATGSSGRLAVRIAKHLGAKRVIATGRNAAVLAKLLESGADEIISLEQSPEALAKAFREAIAASEVRVVLDYLWGSSAELIIGATTGSGRSQAEPRIRFVQIGSMGGGTITMPAAALRSSGLEILGSGLGSNSYETIVEAVGALMNAVVPASLSIATETAPLSDVHEAWNRKTGENRLVFTI